MNKAESSEIGNYLESHGLERVNSAHEADIVILNTCVVRQNAEDRATGMLGYLKGIKSEKTDMRIAVTGCLVDSDIAGLYKRFPHVNYFFSPGETVHFMDWLSSEIILRKIQADHNYLPDTMPVSAYVSIIQGCNNYCSYCIVPYRRGNERSKSPEEILNSANRLIEYGAKEITLVGQNVNAYGSDLKDGFDLAALLHKVNDLAGLERIRFLTNHPKDMSSSLIRALATLEKVCHQICLPLQSGDDKILIAMNRHYTAESYRSLVNQIKDSVPDIAITTDIIVGFPGESEAQFDNTCKAIQEIRFDAVHVAAYSPRSGTYASKNFDDNVPYEIKMQRLHHIESLQTKILTEINQKLVGKTMEVLVEGKKGSKWYGRTGSDKLVFFTEAADFRGKLVKVHITASSPWALQGFLAD